MCSGGLFVLVSGSRGMKPYQWRSEGLWNPLEEFET